MPKNRRLRQREKEKEKRKQKQWRRREFFAKNGEKPGPDRKFNGISDLTPFNASLLIRNSNADPEDVIIIGSMTYDKGRVVNKR